MLWNKDVLDSYSAELIGAGRAWDSYDYRLPFSKCVVTTCRDEKWHVRRPNDEYAYISGQGYSDLHKLLASIEEPLRAAAKKKHEAELAKAYQSWMNRLERLASHIMNDGITQCVIRQHPLENYKFKPLALLVDDHAEIYMDFSDDAKLMCGYVCNKSFTGVPSFHKLTKRYWGFPK